MIEHTYFQDVDMPTLVVGTHVDPFELNSSMENRFTI